MIRAALVTVSTSRASAAAHIPAGTEPAEPDVSGERLGVLAESLGAEIVGRDLIPDDREQISGLLKQWADGGEANLVLTSGGTGFAPSDVTPEATRDVIERPAPGIAEAIRQAAAEHTGNWPLTRNEAGIRGKCLIVNLPGSPRSIDQSAPVLEAVLGHAIALIEDRDRSH